MLTFATSSFAVNSATLASQDAGTSLTMKANKTVFSQVKTFVNKTIIKAKKAIEDDELLMVLLAFVLSPVAVYLYEGQEWTNRCTINLILYIFTFGLGGLIHALYLILGKN